MITSVIFAALAGLSLLLLLWQWLVGVRFELHRRIADASLQPDVTVLKPLKGADSFTEQCLQSWLEQDYRGSVQILFGVASSDDPVCDIVRCIIAKFPQRDAKLVICGPLQGTNAKVSKLVELETMAKHEVVVISDADVKVPRNLLMNAVAPLRTPEVGLVNCFYRLANVQTPAMQWEAVAINADFWSQVLQARSLKPLDFALGAVMVTRRKQLVEIGGFAALINCLADDYQLGHRIARKGYRVELCPVVVECWSDPMGWAAVWKHQLRWARTVRVCQPLPYFFSILSNVTLWALLWTVTAQRAVPISLAVMFILIRMASAFHLEKRLGDGSARAPYFWMPILKDLLQAALWAGAFLGNRVEWRGTRMKLRRDGTLYPVK